MKHGGKRKGAGRHKKPYSERMHKIDLYIKGSIIEKAGDVEALKEYLYQCSLQN